MSIFTRTGKTSIKTTYRVKQNPFRLTARDIDRLTEQASLGVLDIDYAKWLESQVGIFVSLAVDLEAEIEKLEIDRRVARRQAREISVGADGGLHCSFCDKSQHEIKKLIAGPTAYICNECIDICNEIIVDDQRTES